MLGPLEQPRIAEVTARGPTEHATNGRHGGFDLLARGLDVGMERTIAPLAIQILHQCQQTGGFAGLAWGV
ncbi:hypothetical protein [Thiorhodovibrio winogradskyi]|uniref:hypothetical protein n=1 Tax=Thiorhodovibrio winogradskyi TaxID=77007 RepID=UPI002E2B4420|nr:hypothetical protein [Thiorhodovibrio winogradskyi]